MNSKRWVIVLSLAFVAGCSSQSIKDNNSTEGNQIEYTEDSGFSGVPAPSSKFSKLRSGMSPQHVIDTIGSPTDQKVYRTAKSWFPYYYGNDSVRREFIYKNEGRLTFGGNGRLIKITVDETEDGYE